ncbi:RICIN domain-containing protein [Streptomyces canus]|uniref:RICIN domain-containing protein n=1 Tax=Streptomyces canus TaxID=58343 RepID=UPI0032466D48
MIDVLTWGGCRRDQIGLYTHNPNGTGCVDADSVQYTLAPTRAYKCVSVRSGKVAGASNADGAAVIQWPYSGGSNRQWAFQSTPDGFQRIHIIVSRAGFAVAQKGEDCQDHSTDCGNHSEDDRHGIASNRSCNTCTYPPCDQNGRKGSHFSYCVVH